MRCQPWRRRGFNWEAIKDHDILGGLSGGFLNYFTMAFFSCGEGTFSGFVARYYILESFPFPISCKLT